MKIALVNQPGGIIRPPTPGSAISNWIWQVGRRLAGRGQEVTIYCRRGPGQARSELCENVEIRRLNLARQDLVMKLLGPGMKAWGRAEFDSRLYYSGYASMIAADLAASGCDLIHLHNYSQYVPILLRACPDSRLVLHMHCEWLSQRPAQTIVERLENADAVACCSDYITNLARLHLPEISERIQTVYNGVDTRHFTPGPGPAPPRLLFVGRISPEKGIHVLVEAFVLLADKFPQLTLQIVGPPWQLPRNFLVSLSRQSSVAGLERFYPGSYLDALKAMVPPGLVGRVQFTGMVQQAELPSHYQQAQVLVNPSLSESFGVSLIEAMACGVPVVAAATGGMVELVRKSGAGLLVRPDDARSIALALEQLLQQDQLRSRLGEQGRDFARQVDWDRITDQVLELYATFSHSLV